MSKRTDKASPSHRNDRLGPISFGATPTKITDEGFRHYTGTATIGDVILPYSNPMRLEFRPADEVLSDDAIETMVGKPITDDHPEDLLNSDDEEELSNRVKGAVVSAERVTTPGGKPAMKVEIVVYSRRLADKIEDGKVELSPGYNQTSDPPTLDNLRVMGEHEGSPYHVVQRKVKYNHLAVVDRARTRTPAGEVARLDEDDMKKTDKPGEANADAKKTDPSEAAKASPRADMDLSAEAMEKLAELPEEDREMIMKALSSAKGEPEGEGENEDAEECGTMDAKQMMDMMKSLSDKVDAMMSKRADSEPSKPAKQSGQRIDTAEVFRVAEERAAKAATAATAQQIRDIETLRGAGVRVDSYTNEAVFGAMLGEIAKHTPHSKAIAERAIKQGRMDDVRDLFAAATEAAAKARNDAQDDSLSMVFDEKASGSLALPKGSIN